MSVSRLSLRRCRCHRPGWLTVLIVSITMVVAAAPLHARQSDPARSAQISADAQQLLRALTETRVTLMCEATPAREAFEALAARLEVPMIGRYADDALGFGIDPHRPISCASEDALALDVLEDLLEQCSSRRVECTWQIRKGFIEFGTKERLNVPAARERRTYYIGDLIIRIPGTEQDQRREKNAIDLVQDICETIEPGRWDYGQIDYDDPAPDVSPEHAIHASRVQRHGGEDMPDDTDADSGAAADDDADGTTGSDEPAQRPQHRPVRKARPQYVSAPKPASIRYWRDLLIVDAPDYIHRQINGYPGFQPSADARPIAPAFLPSLTETEAEEADDSGAAPNPDVDADA